MFILKMAHAHPYTHTWAKSWFDWFAFDQIFHFAIYYCLSFMHQDGGEKMEEEEKKHIS